MEGKTFLEKYGWIIGAVIGTIVVQAIKKKEAAYWEKQNEELAKMTDEFFQSCMNDPNITVTDF